MPPSPEPPDGDGGGGGAGGGDKGALRRALLARRREVPAARRAADADALGAGVPALLEGVADPVCLHVPVGHEPGAAGDRLTVPPLLAAARDAGRRVLLPVVVGDAPLDWAEFSAGQPLRAARWGLAEPSGPRLGAEAVRQAGLVLVPALAVDRRGVRLGRGGGHYDRTLPGVGPGTRLVALVRDEELVEALPSQEHDVRVGAAWAPRAGLRSLPSRGGGRNGGSRHGVGTP